MKNVPERIYLQISTKSESTTGKDKNEEFYQILSWSINRINENDIEYVISSKLNEYHAQFPVKIKHIKMFSKMSEFEKFANRTDIDILNIDIKVVNQSFIFQESFAGIIYYNEDALIKEQGLNDNSLPNHVVCKINMRPEHCYYREITMECKGCVNNANNCNI